MDNVRACTACSRAQSCHKVHHLVLGVFFRFSPASPAQDSRVSQKKKSVNISPRRQMKLVCGQTVLFNYILPSRVWLPLTMWKQHALCVDVAHSPDASPQVNHRNYVHREPCTDLNFRNHSNFQAVSVTEERRVHFLGWRAAPRRVECSWERDLMFMEILMFASC